MTQLEKKIKALRDLGFEVLALPGQTDSDDSSVLQGNSPVVPGFGFVGAFKLTTSIWLDGHREGNFLVCFDPGTGNLVQIFDLDFDLDRLKVSV